MEKKESTFSIPDSIALVKNDMIKFRRHLHMYPELSLEENKTHDYIVEQLKKLKNYEIQEKVGDTGVVATLRGKADVPKGKKKTFRADMDGLPIQEQSDVEYCSKNKGVMHACGHDGHMAIALGFAIVVSSLQSKLWCDVVLIFQPAEEGHHGAVKMIDGGCLKGVDEIYGLHLWSTEPLGTVCVYDGPLMASSAGFRIKIKGIGGHGAHPVGTRDALLAGCSLVQELNQLISKVDPVHPIAFNIGKFNAGYACNIVADICNMEGTIRAFDMDIRKTLLERIGHVVEGVSMMHDVTVKFEFLEGYPAVVNKPKWAVDRVRQATIKTVGVENVKEHGVQIMGSEDFAYYLQKLPGCFFFVGADIRPKGSKEPVRSHHKSNFDISESSLAIGASIFFRILLDYRV